MWKPYIGNIFNRFFFSARNMFGPKNENARKWGGRPHSDANKNLQRHGIDRSRVRRARVFPADSWWPSIRPQFSSAQSVPIFTKETTHGYTVPLFYFYSFLLNMFFSLDFFVVLFFLMELHGKITQLIHWITHISLILLMYIMKNNNKTQK